MGVQEESKKKKKSETTLSKQVTDCAVEDGFELSKEDKKRKKNKDKKRKADEVFSEAQLDDTNTTHSVKQSVKDYAQVGDSSQKDKEKKKKTKTKSKLEPVEDNEKSNNKFQMGGEERRCLQPDDSSKGLENDGKVKVRKEKKKRHKENQDKDEKEASSSAMKKFEDKDAEKDDVVREQKSSKKVDIAHVKNGDVGERVKRKKRRREEKNEKDDLGAGVQEMMVEELGNKGSMIEGKDFGDSIGNANSTRNKTLETETTNGGKKGKRKKPNSVETGSEDPKPKGKSKKVRFSGDVEVFPASDGPSKGKEKNQDDGLVRGKRFSPEEDEKVKESVFNYIEAHNLGEEGLNMVLRCKFHSKITDCWKEIGSVLPHRPYKAVYYRAHILFERDVNRSWSTDELELVRKFHEKNGPKWKLLADELGKHRVHLKDAWRRIKLPNRKKGNWSQEEYQGLFDLVNMDLRMRVFQEKKSKYGMLRDNISWSAISDKLSTRTDAICCMKWYNQLTSPMVADGIWADVDDYRLLDALFSLDACCVEDVDWDYLLDHRSGDVCRKRWNQMVKHIGEHGNKSFAEQVEILSKRYRPDTLEAREAWDSKPATS